VERPIIAKLVRDDVIVIACGGDGIAVQETSTGELEGVEAAIDKDRASALLAIDMKADLLMIPTVWRRSPSASPTRRAMARPDQRQRSRTPRCRMTFWRRQDAAEDRGASDVPEIPAGRARHDHQC